ncbi:MAG: HK97 family phage prohead protease, partial [Candidatus Nanohaloarchaea archaeon]
MPVNEPSYDVAVETSWDGVDQSEFEDFQEFASVHVWWNTDNPETGEDVELPVAHKEDGELKLVYEALNSAHDLAKQAVGEDNAEQVRELLENLREKEFPDREPLNEKTESRSEAIERIAGYLGKDISEDEVGDCISEKVDEGWDRDRAIAACLSMAESGSVDDEINAMNPETFEEHRQIMEENKDAIERKNFMVKGSDVEVIKDHEDGTVVNVPIQALEEDRDGDFINEKGQESIVSQLKTGRVPLVPNHGVGDSEAHYGFEDIFGQFVDGQNRNGTTIGTARLREDHEKSKELVDLLEQDMPVGFSVGFRVLEADPREKDEGDGEGMEISDVDLMEVSAVGIPSNPEAVPQAMGNAVAMAKNAGM